MTFEDVTAAAGIDDRGISFGASAGDANGDGWPDLFTGGHYSGHPRLWSNNGDGTFSDVVATMQPPPSGDMHGAQWIDLDNDGTQELVLLRGANYGFGSTPKFVYRRIGGQFVDVAAAIGLDVPLMRARTPLAVDYDRDGENDMFLTAQRRSDGRSPPSLFAQLGGGLRDFGPTLGFTMASGTEFGVLGDLDGDRVVDAMFDGFPNRAYSLAATGITDISAAIALPFLPTANDFVVADLTGDGENEIYVACAAMRSSVHRDGPFTIEFRALVFHQEHTVRFTAPAGHLLWFDWELADCPATAVHIGAGGWHPGAFGALLDPAQPANVGIAPHALGVDHGIWIGWDDTTSEWVVSCGSHAWAEGLLRCICSQPVSLPTAIGWNPTALGPGDRLLTRVGGQYVDITAAAGIPPSLHGRSAVAADFDNDMDLDLFVVTTTNSCNTDDVMLENRGDGTFVVVPAGEVNGSPDGIGDSAVTLDYDGDGSVDLFVVNGACRQFRLNGSPGAFGDDGPAQLFRNATDNGNHWLQLDLVGTQSNRAGLGARIEVVAGGVSQVREHGGGMHRYSQNHGIHFGLGQNATATSVTVTWPSGIVTTLQGIAADQRLVVTE